MKTKTLIQAIYIAAAVVAASMLIPGCSKKPAVATMKVMTEIKHETRGGIVGGKIFAITESRSNMWLRQQWKHDGKKVHFDWPVFSSQVVHVDMKNIGDAPAPDTNTILKLLPEEKILKQRDEVQP